MFKQLLASPRSRILVAGVVVVIVVLGVAAARPMVVQWLNKSNDAENAAKGKTEPSHELVRDGAGKPVTPPLLRISAEAARTLGISSQSIVLAKRAVEPRPLPPLEGDLTYQNDNLFPVRPRFAGEVTQFAQVPNEASPPDGNRPTAERYQNWEPTRPIGFGDKVHKGQLLAVVWSKDLGDKKAALIDATIDLNRDRQRLKELEKLYQEGAVSAASYHEARRTVEHAMSAVNAAERTLRIWKLSDSEIDALKKEAATIRAEKRDPEKEKNWARVDVVAPHDGTIVEKNTNLGDWVDPTNGNPMFRIADLNVLAAWLHPLEEYLPLLSRLAGIPRSAPCW
jgi:cobalt-zinc-cadmium efflux system membrane fusion protein